MASEPKTVPARRPAVREHQGVGLASPRLPQSVSSRILEISTSAATQTDLLLLHHNANGPWAAKLAGRITGEKLGNRNIGVSRSACGRTAIIETLSVIEKHLQSGRCVAIVVTKPMLQDDWLSLEVVLALHMNGHQAKGRLIAILRENVTMPACLRLGEWIDFRNDREYESNLRSLVALLGRSMPSAITPASAAARLDVRVKERVVSNLFPVVEVPKLVYSAETSFTTESEVAEACGGPGPLPFLLKNSKLYSFKPFTADSAFGPALIKGSESSAPASSQEDFSQWLYKPDRCEWTIELLNSAFRHHAWKRGMRFDEGHQVYYYSRSKPKNIWWQIGQQTVPREVTAPHMEWIPLGNDLRAEAQFGWRHQAVRATFIQVLGTLFLRMEPAWFLTQIDGRTPMTSDAVGPVNSGSRNPERNGQALRSMRFWSSVLAKGHQELRIATGQEPVRARLVPISGFCESGFRDDQMDYDRLVLAEMEDDLSLPELRPLEQETILRYEEDLPPKGPGSPRGEQAQACI
jgi:hypothetical protein